GTHKDRRVEMLRAPDFGFELNAVRRHRQLQPAVPASAALNARGQLEAASDLMRIEDVAGVDDRGGGESGSLRSDDRRIDQADPGSGLLEARVDGDAPSSRQAEASASQAEASASQQDGNGALAAGDEREAAIAIDVGDDAGDTHVSARREGV